jgi:hypothetical protein
MNQHLAKAIAIYEQEGIDFQQLLTWHLCHGVVICDMDCFAMHTERLGNYQTFRDILCVVLEQVKDLRILVQSKKMISRLTRTILYKPSTKTVDIPLEQEGQDTAEA